MSSLETISISFRSLKQRTEDAFDTMDIVNRQYTKTTNGMDDLCRRVRDMRERVVAIMTIQDGLTFRCKGIDKIMLGTMDMSFAAEPIQCIPRRKKDHDEDYTSAPKDEVVLDSLSDDEYTPVWDEPTLMQTY